MRSYEIFFLMIQKSPTHNQFWQHRPNMSDDRTESSSSTHALVRVINEWTNGALRMQKTRYILAFSLRGVCHDRAHMYAYSTRSIDVYANNNRRDTMTEKGNEAIRLIGREKKKIGIEGQICDREDIFWMTGQEWNRNYIWLLTRFKICQGKSNSD